MTSNSGLYIVIFLIVVSVFSGAVAYHYKTTNTLNREISNLHKKNLALNINYEKAARELEDQNTKIKELSAETAQQMQELNKWKSLKPEIRYKNIYKYITKEKSNDCQSVSDTVNAIRNINFSEL